MEAAARNAAHQCRLFSVIPTAINGIPGLASNNDDDVNNNITNRRPHTQFNPSTLEDSISGTQDQDSISDCESGVCGTNTETPQLFDNGLVKLDEEDRLHEIIKRRFVSGLGSLGLRASVVAIHRNSCSSFTAQARLQSFHIFAGATEKKLAGSPNLKYAWFGASRDEIQNIVSHGFGHCQNDGLYGRGIYLSPDDSSLER